MRSLYWHSLNRDDVLSHGTVQVFYLTTTLGMSGITGSIDGAYANMAGLDQIQALGR